MIHSLPRERCMFHHPSSTSGGRGWPWCRVPKVSPRKTIQNCWWGRACSIATTDQQQISISSPFQRVEAGRAMDMVRFLWLSLVHGQMTLAISVDGLDPVMSAIWKQNSFVDTCHWVWHIVTYNIVAPPRHQRDKQGVISTRCSLQPIR